jgi:response regulator RpfG family c-di-GMP phosphodiesterase
MLHEIKKEQEFKSLPVILLTGMLDELGVNLVAGVEDEELFPHVRFQDKPIDPVLLMEIIHEMLKLQKIDVRQYYQTRKDKATDKLNDLK